MVKKVLLVLFLSSISLTAYSQTVGPLAYFGTGSNTPDAIFIQPAFSVSDTETEFISFRLFTQDAFSDQDMHFAIGGRGPTLNNGQAPFGRGIAFGYLSSVFGCNGVQIEDFTLNRTIGPSVSGVGVCKSLPLINDQILDIDIHISENNVAYWIYRVNNVFTGSRALILSGGCFEDTGVFCPQQPQDGDSSNAFIGSAFLGANYDWVATNIYVGEF